nr:hypothetical protein Xcnt_15410 [Xanthomonas campestris pv. centellae]
MVSGAPGGSGFAKIFRAGRTCMLDGHHRQCAVDAEGDRFAITVVVIGITTRLVETLGVGLHIAWVLSPGPLHGLLALVTLWRRQPVVTSPATSR